MNQRPTPSESSQPGTQRKSSADSPARKKADEQHDSAAERAERERLDRLADEASEESFPASDPPATNSSSVGVKR